MKSTLTIFICILTTLSTYAQVPKKVVVEHFTNTRCSICASRNPDFYTNLTNHPDILHMSVHPSSPYSNCALNNHNPDENDDRTKYYGQYGGTPRFTIQGDNIAGNQSTSNASLFTPYTGKTSEASIQVRHDKSTGSSIEVSVSVKTEASHSYGNLRLFVALVEDTVAYQAPNGENFHYDVFRKAMTDIEGDVMSLPTNVGDSVTFTFTENVNSAWSLNRMYALVIVQEEGNKAVVQSAATLSEPTGNPVGIISQQNSELFRVYPNPGNVELNIELLQDIDRISLTSITGKVVFEHNNYSSGNHSIDVSSLNRGMYILQIQSGLETKTQKILLE